MSNYSPQTSLYQQQFMKTDKQYDEVINSCREVFIRKAQDYGTSWRVLRPISIIDQIFIKAQRIRTIQEKGAQKINEDIAGEFKAIVNYGVIGLMQLDFNGTFTGKSLSYL